jgi:predicted extracellular nuclease
LARLSATLPLACLTLALSAPASAALMISQVYGGGGGANALTAYANDYVELHNSGAAAVSLVGYSVQYGSAAGTTWSGKVTLSGSIPAGGYYLIQLAAGGTAGAALPLTPDATGTIAMSATAGKVALVSNTTTLAGACPIVPANAAVLDFVGYGATANCSETAVAPPPASVAQALFRANAGTNSCQDTNNNGADFSSAAAQPRNSGSAAQACSSGGGGGGGGGGGAATARKIYDIQGSGSTSPFATQNVITSGVVTKVNNNGFFMQDAIGDGNPATSDGLFVFTGATAYPAVAVGNLVEVTGTVVEFNVGSSADTSAHTVTEISPVSTITLTSSGNSITPTVVTLPEAVNDELERYEGMLVTINGPFTVGQNYFQGRYGQMTLSVGGRLQTPTNAFRPGTPAYLALVNQNARSSLILDDGSSLQNPNPTPYLAAGLDRAGNTIATLTGVVDYGLATASAAGLGDYKIHPTVTPVFVASNARTTTPPAVGGNVKLGSFNVLNFFTTFTNGATASGQTGQGCSLGGGVSAGNCRGADSLDEFLRQRAKIVEAIAAINADAYGLMEIQNNGSVAAQNLVDALNAKVGAGTYAVVADPVSGMGDDAIKTAIIYKPSRLAPFGGALSDTAAINNRPTLAQTFVMANGEKFTVMVNHLKSKSGCGTGADADAGDGQGCYNGTRVAQAQRLRTFVAQVQASSGSKDVLLVGDFNAYAKEDPINELTSTAASVAQSGYVDQIAAFNAFEYSYVFDGAAGYIDHAITTSEMASKVAFATHWHINADESLVYDYNVEFKAPLTTCSGLCPADPYTVDPYRASDHDPVVLGLLVYKTMLGSARSDTITGTPGDDYIWGGGGADLLTGNGGSNVYGYFSMKDAGDTITDFVPGKDRIDLRLMLADLHYSGNDAVADGYVRFASAGGGTAVFVGVGSTRALVTLSGVSPASLSSLRDLIIR